MSFDEGLKKNIAILISGGGGLMTRAILESRKNNSKYNVKVVIGSSIDCRGLIIAKEQSVLTHVVDFSDKKFWDIKSNEVFEYLDNFKNIDFVILLGWVKKITLKNEWFGKVYNIHPSLLPKYGGKGMFGYAVHRAVIENKEKESGFTLHSIDDEYDKGKTLFQYKLNINKSDTPVTLQDKIISLQHEKLFEIINRLCLL
jgi:phosphoribosylglycinamide formyltransferase-1